MPKRKNQKKKSNTTKLTAEISNSEESNKKRISGSSINKILTTKGLNEKICGITEYYKKYSNEKRIIEIQKIAKYLDNQEYKIAVVANMSSGKSTFINALFGKEVLPAFNHATTDSATFIYSKLNIDKKAVIYFSDGRKPVEIKNDIEEEIKQYAQKDEECEDEKHKNVEKIELFYPFQNLQTSNNEDFSITFIDTPGPNSTGDNYKQKHKDQTRNVLNDVDLALFMFDYTQLDANLTSDEQGLWNTIKKRHEKDENFDVYFLLNKIDFALDDNFKEIDTKDEKEFIRLKKENWFIHEQSAIKKLQDAAKKHGIIEPKIYPIVSKFQLSHRDTCFYNKRALRNFQEEFEDVFGNSWEDEFISYMGISKLEMDINKYINSSVKNKILKKVNFKYTNVVNDEIQDLELRLQTLRKPKEEAENNLKQADDFLQGRAKKMQEEMQEDSFNLFTKYRNNIEDIIDKAIEEKFINKIDQISKETIAFATAFAKGNSVRVATKKSKENASSIILDEDKVEIEISKKIDKQQVMIKMQEFMTTIFEDHKRDYLDIKSDIKEVYFNLEIESEESFSKYKKELEKELKNVLDVTIPDLKPDSLDYIDKPDVEIDVPSSVLDYQFDQYEEQVTKQKKVKRGWYNPARWFGDTYVLEKYETTKTVESHTFIISPKQLKESIEKSLEYSTEIFASNEKEVHEDTIKNYLDKNSEIFQAFRHDRQKEINRLKQDIQESEKNLEIVQIQHRTFEKYIQD
jgi:GTPase Era involved in 16S rRNA processing